ncbi:MAG: bifunctional methylenetetrahydrofolate dehydrogenase/methenyltetrahydrofolate cyclohydrolase FolD [Bradymonadales bacterium]|nr:MAG: bifunctional methylenetetrahydrofolate dehydrogenase/methenyltetrahydrofolate cyclohydrolase FolD [Bradymonadales bacterium]
MTQILNGNLVSKERMETLKQRVGRLGGRPPALHVIRVGDDVASEIYVKKKIEKCQFVGIQSKEWPLQASTSQQELLDLVERLNQDDSVDGVLIQLPLPDHVGAGQVLEALKPAKDVDGFHPYNLGKLLAREVGLVPCTPLGIMSLLEHYDIEVAGKKVVVIGRSRIVGRPLSLLFDQAGGTVTVVHQLTKDPAEVCKQADILVAACGRPELIGPERVKEGAVVIDVGIHRLPSGKLCGDVQFEKVKDHCSWITPVPGGVGPMTICSLLENTVQAYQTKRL